MDILQQIHSRTVSLTGTTIAIFSIGLQGESGNGKITVDSVSDLPRIAITLEALPSVILQEEGAPLEKLLADVEADALEVLEKYEITDATTRRSFITSLYTVAFIRKEWERVLELGPLIRSLQSKPALKLVSNLSTDAYAAAALASTGPDEESFAKAFSEAYYSRIKELDFPLIQDSLESLKGQMEMVTPGLIVGSVLATLDPNAKAQGMKIDRDFASSLIGVIQAARLAEHKESLVNVLATYLEANKTEKPDRWSERLADLSEAKNLTPVVVANWDSGMDTSIFPGRLWTNGNESFNGKDDDGNGFVDDVHGIAFNKDNLPAVGALREMPEEDLANIDDYLDLIVGSMDQRANIDSEAARKLRETIARLSPEEVQDFTLRLGRLGLYSHGTMTAHVSAEDNPAIRLLFVRFNMDVKPVPDPFDEAYAESFSEYVRQVVNYLKQAGTRVVNMSWRITTPMIEAGLASVEPDADKRRDRAIAIYETMLAAMTGAIDSAPDILFIAGAGNEDENVDFVRSMPAGMNRPNVITVGAVDVALEPASFTSFGKSIDVYANGFEVRTRMPGGKQTIISGTSLAAPYVTNLAAKLFAKNPDLSVAEVRQLIEQSATIHGEEQIRIIHPRAALSSMR